MSYFDSRLYIVGLVHGIHSTNIEQARPTNVSDVPRSLHSYHAACKVEFQPFKRSYSQLTFFNILQKLFIKAYRYNYGYMSSH